MPIIVPIEENLEGIAGLTDAKFHAPDTSGSGLEALGAGLTKVGQGGEQFAGALDEKRKRELAAIAAIAAAKLDDEHQRNIDDATVKNAYVAYSDLTHEALHGHDGLFNRRGAETHAAFPELVGNLIDHHDKVLAPLDKVQRAAVAPVLGARLRSDVDLAANHVREQGKAEQELQSHKLQQAAARDAVANLGDRDLHDHHIATGENAIRQQAMLNGSSDKDLDQRLADYRTAVAAASTDALAARDANAIDRDQRFRDARPAVDSRPAKALPIVPGELPATNPNEPDAAWQTTPYALTPAMAYRLAPGTSALRPGIDFADDSASTGFGMRDIALDISPDDMQSGDGGHVTFDPNGRPTTGNDGRSLGETIWRKVFGGDTPPPPRHATISRVNRLDTNLFAQLSEAVYDDDTMFDTSEVAVPAHKYGFKTRDFRLTDGLVAKIYEVGDAVVLAFVGTELNNRSRVGVDFGDLRADAANDVGLGDTQFAHAVEIARLLKARIGNRQLILTGHSLGGGLASLAAVATHSRAFTFNAAGVRDHVLRQYGATRQDAERLVVETYYRLDPLSNAQSNGVVLPGGIPYRLAQPIGIRRPVGPLRGLPNHSMSAILGALNNP